MVFTEIWPFADHPAPKRAGCLRAFPWLNHRPGAWSGRTRRGEQLVLRRAPSRTPSNTWSEGSRARAVIGRFVLEQSRALRGRLPRDRTAPGAFRPVDGRVGAPRLMIAPCEAQSYLSRFAFRVGGVSTSSMSRVLTNLHGPWASRRSADRINGDWPSQGAAGLAGLRVLERRMVQVRLRRSRVLGGMDDGCQVPGRRLTNVCVFFFRLSARCQMAPARCHRPMRAEAVATPRGADRETQVGRRISIFVSSPRRRSPRRR